METLLINAEPPALLRIHRSERTASPQIEMIAEILGIVRRDDRSQGMVVSLLPRTAEGWISPATSPALLTQKTVTITLSNDDALIGILALDVKEDTYQPWDDLWRSQSLPYYKERVANHISGADLLFNH